MTKDNITMRLTFDVEFDPQGETADELKRRLYQMVRDSTSNGVLTGDSGATVEHYTTSIREITKRRKQ